jgi:hypothetical protein
MRNTLEYLKAELNVNISTICHHLRNRAYPQNSEAQYNAMSSLVYYQVLVDELKNLLYSQSQLIESLEKCLRGELYDIEYVDSDEQEPIHDFCLTRFEGEFALGSCTPELAQWVATHADRQQDLRQIFYAYFPDVKLSVAEADETGAIDFRPASDAEKFESDTTGFLRDIETSNALIEFNQLMQQVKELLIAKAPVAQVLTVLKQAN